MGMLWVNILALIVVGWILSALSYVSTFLGLSVFSGVVSTVQGPLNLDVVYPDAEEYYRQNQPGSAPSADKPKAE